MSAVRPRTLDPSNLDPLATWLACAIDAHQPRDLVIVHAYRCLKPALKDVQSAASRRWLHRDAAEPIVCRPAPNKFWPESYVIGVNKLRTWQTPKRTPERMPKRDAEENEDSQSQGEGRPRRGRQSSHPTKKAGVDAESSG